VEPSEFNQAYVTSLAAGDPETQHHFIHYFGDLLSIKLRCRVRATQSVEDLRQEVFLRVFRALRANGGIEHPERLGGYVNSVCNNVIFEFYRSGAKNPAAPENVPEQADARMDIEARLVSGEREEAVRRVLGELPEKDRAILRQVFLEEQDRQAVCERFGVNAGYLRVLVHRAKGRFRAVLAKTATAGGVA
jgi:RNA polymerase sigma-70 factor (ECF subfamily)